MTLCDIRRRYEAVDAGEGTERRKRVREKREKWRPPLGLLGVGEEARAGGWKVGAERRKAQARVYERQQVRRVQASSVLQ